MADWSPPVEGEETFEEVAGRLLGNMQIIL